MEPVVKPHIACKEIQVTVTFDIRNRNTFPPTIRFIQAHCARIVNHLFAVIGIYSDRHPIAGENNFRLTVTVQIT
jgi:hypothetical protein